MNEFLGKPVSISAKRLSVGATTLLLGAALAAQGAVAAHADPAPGATTPSAGQSAPAIPDTVGFANVSNDYEHVSGIYAFSDKDGKTDAFYVSTALNLETGNIKVRVFGPDKQLRYILNAEKGSTLDISRKLFGEGADKPKVEVNTSTDKGGTLVFTPAREGKAENKYAAKYLYLPTEATPSVPAEYSSENDKAEGADKPGGTTKPAEDTKPANTPDSNKQGKDTKPTEGDKQGKDTKPAQPARPSDSPAITAPSTAEGTTTTPSHSGADNGDDKQEGAAGNEHADHDAQQVGEDNDSVSEPDSQEDEVQDSQEGEDQDSNQDGDQPASEQDASSSLADTGVGFQAGIAGASLAILCGVGALALRRKQN